MIVNISLRIYSHFTLNLYVLSGFWGNLKMDLHLVSFLENVATEAIILRHYERIGLAK